MRSTIRRSAIRLSSGRALRLQRLFQKRRFVDSAGYWESRYAGGGDSGAGSFGDSAKRKAEFLNAFVSEHGVDSVIELGCGDGAQLALATYPRYVGYDVSPTIVDHCRGRFVDDTTKQFRIYRAADFLSELGSERFDLALSLDVAYHLVEDEVYRAHIEHLLASADRYVIVYSTDVDVPSDRSAVHVRHRMVSRDIARVAEWELISRTPGLPPSADEPALEFMVFAKS